MQPLGGGQRFLHRDAAAHPSAMLSLAVTAICLSTARRTAITMPRASLAGSPATRRTRRRAVNQRTQKRTR
ncbi:hypothetical protein I553_3029 [Mycobacterium xenopi 4042]|uniref:Uncharacterized protein n=1 Tax=Mycobacterium xenopi 4042 TaxID=1299334 RepID=X7ZMY6_MYCXE|nr:hypothetical protein I553_3029 [Mycobacterium xenopi 4042]